MGGSQRKNSVNTFPGVDGGEKNLCTQGIISSHMSFAEASKPSFPSILCNHTRPKCGLIKPRNVKSYTNKQVEMESLDQSHVNRHDVRLVERLRTVWALPHTVGNSILNTVVAESMATRLDGNVLEVIPANGA
jgi:hypothetical protein